MGDTIAQKLIRSHLVSGDMSVPGSEIGLKIDQTLTCLLYTSDKATAEMYHNVFVDTCKLAQKLGVDTIVTFSGCPGDCPESKRPNWVTCAWPPEYGETLEYQWNDVLLSLIHI